MDPMPLTIGPTRLRSGLGFGGPIRGSDSLIRMINRWG